MSDYISDVIARADAKGKILDFRNNLVQAKPEHYAMMHGTGGREFARVSTIKLCMTDYSGGTGDNSVYVNANVSPSLIERIMSVCEQNVGDVYAPSPVNIPSAAEALKLARDMLQAASGAGESGDKVLSVPYGKLVELGKTISAANAEIAKANEAATQLTKPNVQFNVKQERVNVYSRDDRGLVSVSTLQITRQGIRKDGEVSRMPWSVKVSNFKAKPIEQSTGATSYDGKTACDKKEVYINITDEAMHDCCYRVLRFCEVWENANCIPAILAAQKAKERAWNETQGQGA